MTSKTVSDHISSFRTLVTEAKQSGAIFVNSHSGCECWTINESRIFLAEALKIEKEVGINVMHETHRKRILWNPFNYRDVLLGQKELADIKVNLDISHWVVILERCFGSKESDIENGSDDSWWTPVKDMLKQNVRFVHARVGWAEGSQVADPSAAEYANDVSAHVDYWDIIIQAQIDNGRDCFIEPEHGPWPY